MLRTISVSNYITVEGNFVQAFPNGRIAIRVGKRLLESYPVTTAE